MSDLYTLESMIELCFGDEEDPEGLADLKLQLDIYPDRQLPFMAQLDAVIERADPDESRRILGDFAQYSHISDAQAIEWFRWLRRELAG